MTTHYNSSSRGPVEIASMRYEHALNARDKLMRERSDDSRDAEIAALNDHIAGIEATFEERADG
ncbi:hypothetical protein [Phenylobacterium soli]|uniref:Uncharacterized protein n=1 Tax=Phenylobacterium soli TaxID=2170551 RepID=A0A328AAZ4_9CAUL|nr:hypothetical protein [Phenylobacterium soli]RAK51627.1 hypothetical protein DJ017_17480 [Phenylobacterium soli]